MVLTSEELRTAALEASAKRSKSVARRRLMTRWTMWFLWTILFPVLGFAVVLAAVVGLGAWLYMGSDAAYHSAQGWWKQQAPALSRPFDASPQPMPQLRIDSNYLNIKPANIDNGKVAVKETIKIPKTSQPLVSEPPKNSTTINSTTISTGQQP
jgi:hypothetical protein